jgi:hypothetical protein
MALHYVPQIPTIQADATTNVQINSKSYLAPNERVIMFDGTMKKIQDLIKGDILMGADSFPRKIRNTFTGVDEMFKIVPIIGEPYTVTGSHIISLVSTCKPTISIISNNQYAVKWCENGTRKFKSFRPLTEEGKQRAIKFMNTVPQIDYINMSLRDYMNKSNGWKAYYKGYRIGVRWPDQYVPLDPYILGAWLGDGSSNGPEITNIDEEILDHLRSVFDDMDLIMTPRLNKSITYGISRKDRSHGVENQLTDSLRQMDLINNKHIPQIYKTNSKDVRLEVLAGLLDTDGHYQGNCYEITQKRQDLLYDIAFVARSLGFCATVSEVQKTCTNAPGGPKTGTYYRCGISGSGLEEIPVKISKKKAHERQQAKDALRFGFTVQPLGLGPYCGFELEGNHRYLLKDFTVTHS